MITFCPVIRAFVNIFRWLLWSHWASFAQISYGASLDWRNIRLIKWSQSVDQDGHHANIWVKTFKNLLLQNLGCLGAESLHKSSGTGGLPKLLKWMSYIDIRPFHCEVKFASLCICMGPIHLYGKNVENYKRLLHWSCQANVAQISSGASLGQGN